MHRRNLWLPVAFYTRGSISWAVQLCVQVDLPASSNQSELKTLFFFLKEKKAHNEEQRAERRQGEFHASMQSSPRRDSQGKLRAAAHLHPAHPSNIFVPFNAHSRSKQRDGAAEKTSDPPVTVEVLRSFRFQTAMLSKTCRELFSIDRRHLHSPSVKTASRPLRPREQNVFMCLKCVYQ